MQGRETLFRIFERGEQFGMMLGALQEPVPVRVFALEPSTVLQVDYEQAMELTLKHPDLRQAWLRTYAGSLRKEFFGVAPKRAPMMLGLIHETSATRGVAERLVDRLRQVGEQLAVFSDSEQWRGSPDVRFRSAATGREVARDRGDPPTGGRVAGRHTFRLRPPGTIRTGQGCDS